MTVNRDKNPTNTDNQIFSITGTISDPINGVVYFTPSSIETTQTAGTYYYDIVMVTASNPRTLVKAKFNILQGIKQ